MARNEAHALRLALIYALADGKSVIDSCHIEAALALIEHSEQAIRHIFGNSTGNPTADVIIRALETQPIDPATGRRSMINRSDISALLGRNASAAAINQALGVLADLGRAYGTKVITGGRPSELWGAP